MGAPVKTGKAPVVYKQLDCLTEKQRRWVEEYLRNGKNGPLAYARVYAQNWKEGDPVTKNHRVTSTNRMLKNPKIMKILAETEEKVHKVTVKVMDKYAITQERVLEELAALAFTNQTDLVEWSEGKVKIKDSAELTPEAKAAITEVIETKAGVRVKLADKQQALLTIAKHLGLMNEKIEHEHRHVQFVITKD
jgi:phage terminase small subunit